VAPRTVQPCIRKSSMHAPCTYLCVGTPAAWHPSTAQTCVDMQEIPSLGCVVEVPLAFAAKRLMRTPAAVLGFPAAGGRNTAAGAAAMGSFRVADAADRGSATPAAAGLLEVSPLVLQVRKAPAMKTSPCNLWCSPS